MEMGKEYIEVQEETIIHSFTTDQRFGLIYTHKPMGPTSRPTGFNIPFGRFLPAPPYLLLSPPYIFEFPKMSLYNILNYVIWKSFFKFIINFQIM